MGILMFMHLDSTPESSKGLFPATVYFVIGLRRHGAWRLRRH